MDAHGASARFLHPKGTLLYLVPQIIIVFLQILELRKYSFCAFQHCTDNHSPISEVFVLHV